jgi:hypothetical protein
MFSKKCRCYSFMYFQVLSKLPDINLHQYVEIAIHVEVTYISFIVPMSDVNLSNMCQFWNMTAVSLLV